MSSEIITRVFEGHFESEEEATKTGLEGWKDLVMRGYGFTGDDTYAKEQFAIEYCKPQESRIIAFSKDGIIVASLVLARNQYFGNLSSFGVHGIVVLPEYKGKGLGKKLYKEAAKNAGVDIISGSTKTPSAVLARANGVAEHGMRTFYGPYEVTSPSRNGMIGDHLEFLAAYLANKEKFPGEVVIFRSTDILLPDVPDLSDFPDHIKHAFEPVVTRQKEVGDAKTAVMPLLSIKEGLL